MDTTRWQELWPEHANQIGEKLDDLLAALNGLTGTALDPMVEAAATRWVIERLEGWMSAEMTAEIERPGDDN